MHKSKVLAAAAVLAFGATQARPAAAEWIAPDRDWAGYELIYGHAAHLYEQGCLRWVWPNRAWYNHCGVEHRRAYVKRRYVRRAYAK